MNIHLPILRRLLLNPLRTAVIDDQRTWRAIDLLVGAYHIASEITRSSERQTVGIMVPTSGLFPMVALGAWIAGRTVVPLNYLLKRDELQFVVEDCETDVVFTVQPMLDAIGFAPTVKRLIHLENLNFKRMPEFRWPAAFEEESVAALLYTSGTSARPKGVMLTHGNVCSNISQARRWASITHRDVLLGVLPQFHSFGFTVLTLVPLTIGARAVYSARFVPSRVVKLIREHQATACVAIPSMLNAMLHVKHAAPEDFSSLRFLVSGGEPLPNAVAEGFKERFGITINEGYGLTETSPITNWCLPEHYAMHSVGRALPDIDQRIVDPATGHVLPTGSDGEIRMRGPNIMKGYFKLPEQTAAVFDEHGYFKTGDMGRLDETGRLYITGRIKEMIIVGGENVFPREIEEVLNSHPSVHESAVIGVMDDVRGELPWAFVEMKEGSTFSEHELRGWCRERLANYKVPREIRSIQTLPRNPTGKILRRELKALVDSERGASTRETPKNNDADAAASASVNPASARERTRTSTP